MKGLRLVGAVCAILTFSASSLNAATWTEVGNAGNLPATAQTVSGVGSLTSIVGTIDSSVNATWRVDMYEIYLPTASAQFSAQVSIPSPPTGVTGFTAQLFLFGSNGIGLYASQDPNNTFLSYSPTTAGSYYLAISPTNIDPYGPKDQFGFDQPIWNDSAGASAPDGPAASLPVTGWGGSESQTDSGYVINLSGAEFVAPVPVPPALFLFATGFLGLVGMARKRSA